MQSRSMLSLIFRFCKVLNKEEAKQALTMNNGYFFGLLDRMIDGETPLSTSYMCCCNFAPGVV